MRSDLPRFPATTLGLALLAACAACSPAKVASRPAAAPAPRIEEALHAAEAAPPAPPGSALLRIEDGAEICMLSNRYFGSARRQVPVAVGDKTYYGCCAGCAARLGANEPARSAVDPISQRPVDKASAILARTANDAVLYFESEQTFAQYQRTRTNAAFK